MCWKELKQEKQHYNNSADCHDGQWPFCDITLWLMIDQCMCVHSKVTVNDELSDIYYLCSICNELHLQADFCLSIQNIKILKNHTVTKCPNKAENSFPCSQSLQEQKNASIVIEDTALEVLSEILNISDQVFCSSVSVLQLTFSPLNSSLPLYSPFCQTSALFHLPSSPWQV